MPAPDLSILQDARIFSFRYTEAKFSALLQCVAPAPLRRQAKLAIGLVDDPHTPQFA
jgi:hypothetical protein